MSTLLNLTAALMAEGGLPDLLTSGTAIVVYIFVILTAIAALVVVILAGGRDRKESKTEKSPSPAADLDSAALPLRDAATAAPDGATRFCMLSRIESDRHRYGHPRYDTAVTLDRFCEDFRNYAAYKLKLYYDINDIRRFVAGMAVSKILILQGMSGTGKTSLAHAFGEFVDNRSTVIPVQPMWKERTDLIGYYNEFTRRFNETLLLE